MINYMSWRKIAMPRKMVPMFFPMGLYLCLPTCLTHGTSATHGLSQNALHPEKFLHLPCVQPILLKLNVHILIVFRTSVRRGLHGCRNPLATAMAQTIVETLKVHQGPSNGRKSSMVLLAGTVLKMPPLQLYYHPSKFVCRVTSARSSMNASKPSASHTTS